MSTPSSTARTQFSLLGLFSQRYGSFAGKTPAVVIDFMCAHFAATSPSLTFAARAPSITFTPRECDESGG